MDLKILIAVPCLYNAHVCFEAITSILNRSNVDVLILDNGAEAEVKDILEKFAEYPNVTILREGANIYVNPAWNVFVKYFKDRLEYTHLILYNSDVLMQHDFHHVLKNRWVLDPEEVLVPTDVDKVSLMNRVDTTVQNATALNEQVAGIFITLSRKQATFIFPISEKIRIWFGDSACYFMLSKLGYKIVSPPNLRCHHIGSETVKRLPELQTILDQDKAAWPGVKQELEEKIKKLKTCAS